MPYNQEYENSGGEAGQEMLRRLMQDHAKAEERNPIKCRYCGKEIPIGEEKRVRIRVNREWCEYVFCTGDCAGYYQMGCEG